MTYTKTLAEELLEEKKVNIKRLENDVRDLEYQIEKEKYECKKWDKYFEEEV